MLSQSQIRAVASRAAAVVRESGAKRRIDEDGYTRIDPFRVAQDAGVLVMLRPLEKLLGAFIRERHPGILVNSERPAGLIQMTCAHELGHYYLGHDTAADVQLDYGKSAVKTELEADVFAYNLVAPRWAVARIMQRKGWSAAELAHPFVLYQFSLRLGISFTAAAWSLNRLNLMSRSVVEKVLRTQPSVIKRSLLQQQPGNAQQDVWLLDDGDRDLILEPRFGDSLIIRLKNNTNAGYVWTANDVASEGFVVEPLLRSASDTENDERFIAGGARYQDSLVCFGEAASTGIRRLQLDERKAWDHAQHPMDTFQTAARYEILSSGLSSVAKDTLLQGGNES